MIEDADGKETKEFDYAAWEKDLDRHPAFMKGVPGSGEKYSEALEALQAMKYDDDDDSLEDKAKIHKTDGNKHFELKKYRWAVDSYTEGIRLQCSDRTLNAELYANRAAAHYRLQNYRSAFKDCFAATKFKPDYAKAVLRGADCLAILGMPERLIQWCDAAIKIDGSLAPKLAPLKKTAEEQKKVLDRDLRKQQREEATNSNKIECLRKAMIARNIRFWEPENFNLESRSEFNFDRLQVELGPHADTTCVELDPQTDTLTWPVLLFYPEFETFDMIRAFPDNSTFSEQLEEVVAMNSERDTKNEYNMDTIQVMFESFTECDTMCRVPLSAKLRDILANQRYRLKEGSPAFVVLAQNDFYQQYANNAQYKLVSI